MKKRIYRQFKKLQQIHEQEREQLLENQINYEAFISSKFDLFSVEMGDFQFQIWHTHIDQYEHLQSLHRQEISLLHKSKGGEQ